MDGWTLTGDGLLATRLRRSSDDRLETSRSKTAPPFSDARSVPPPDRPAPVAIGRFLYAWADALLQLPVPVRLVLEVDWPADAGGRNLEYHGRRCGDRASRESFPQPGTYVLGVVGGATPLARVRTRGGRVIAVYPPGESRWRSALRRTARRVLMSSTRRLPRRSTACTALDLEGRQVPLPCGQGGVMIGARPLAGHTATSSRPSSAPARQLPRCPHHQLLSPEPRCTAP